MPASRGQVTCAIAGTALLSVSGFIFYQLFKKDDDYDDEGESGGKVTASRHVCIEVTVPRFAVGAVIGRQGENIKKIQDENKVNINFKDQGGEGNADRICVIRGSPEKTQYAETLILQIIANQPRIETIEMFVPQRACGRIIGRNGDTIRDLQAQAGAKIIVERGGETKDPNGLKKITIRGASDCIKLGRELIEQKMEEDREQRERILNSTQGRTLRIRGKEGDPDTVGGSEVNRQVALIPSAPDGFMDVFVSAVESAGHFWLQIVGPKSTELDKLVESMTQFYTEDNNKTQNILPKVEVGCIVASKFPHDDSWYRGEVKSIIKDEYSPDDTQLGVYYVDFGDSVTVRAADVYAVPSQFLALQYQAVECYLGKVKPKGGVWSVEGSDKFEELSHAAQWKVVMAKITGYHNAADGKRTPVVELVDTNGEKDVNIGDELVAAGFAERETS